MHFAKKFTSTFFSKYTKTSKYVNNHSVRLFLKNFLTYVVLARKDGLSIKQLDQVSPLAQKLTLIKFITDKEVCT